MLFVLIALLITGITAASLINNSVLSNKIISNYINHSKAELTAKRGHLLIEQIKKEKLNTEYPLAICLDSDYNIRINMEKDNKYNNNTKIKIIGNYRNNSKVIYHNIEQEAVHDE